MTEVKLLSKAESETAINSLILKGFAERQGESGWLTTPNGQIEASKLWMKLSPDERLLMILSLRGLITTEFLFVCT